MYKICVGIISYLPDDDSRVKRFERLENLVGKINELFAGVRIVIISQNWKDEFIDGVTLVQHGKLGIVGARKALREYFLSQTDDSWLICFDDDNILEGEETDGARLISILNTKNDGYLTFKKVEFKLCALSRAILSEFDIPILDIEKEEGIEDYAFFEILRGVCPEKELRFEWGTLCETSRFGYLPTYKLKNFFDIYYRTKIYIAKTVKQKLAGME